MIGDAEDWKPLGATVVWLHLIASVAASCLLIFLSAPLARLLNEPGLVTYLRLFALDIPFFSLALAHRNLLIGIGAFRQRALAKFFRSISGIAMSFIYKDTVTIGVVCLSRVPAAFHLKLLL